MPQLDELAELVGGDIIGDGKIQIFGIAGLDGLHAGVITFGENENTIKTAVNSVAAAVIVPRQISELSKPAIRVDNPRLAFAKILDYFSPKELCVPGIHASAVVGEGFTDYGCQVGPLVCIGKNVIIGKGTIIYPGVVLEDEVVIGEDCIIHANVVIRSGCRIENRVQIHAGTVIGADGFGYVTIDGQHLKMPQLGIVVIEDDVEIGANSAIDRATTNVTLVKQGTKIDNLVQVGHNCIIGENCILCGQTGLAGSTIVGERVTLAARVGSVGHIEIGHDSVATGCAKIINNLPPQSFVSGDPARPHSKQMRIQASLSRLPEIVKEVRELRKILTELKEK